VTSRGQGSWLRTTRAAARTGRGRTRRTPPGRPPGRRPRRAGWPATPASRPRPAWGRSPQPTAGRRSAPAPTIVRRRRCRRRAGRYAARAGAPPRRGRGPPPAGRPAPRPRPAATARPSDRRRGPAPRPAGGTPPGRPDRSGRRARPGRPRAAAPVRAARGRRRWPPGPASPPPPAAARWTGCQSCPPGACQSCFANSRRCWDPSGSSAWLTKRGFAFTPPLDPQGECRVRNSRCYYCRNERYATPIRTSDSLPRSIELVATSCGSRASPAHKILGQPAALIRRQQAQPGRRRTHQLPDLHSSSDRPRAFASLPTSQAVLLPVLAGPAWTSMEMPARVVLIRTGRSSGRRSSPARLGAAQLRAGLAAARSVQKLGRVR
jgi:hypothetical protein